MFIPKFYILVKIFCNSCIVENIKVLFIFLKDVIFMKKNKTIIKTKLFSLQTLSDLAYVAATVEANSRCAYIYHNPHKPEELQRLKKF